MDYSKGRRRTTLGALSQSKMNVRLSLGAAASRRLSKASGGGGGGGTGSSHRGAASRHSMAPGMHARRQSSLKARGSLGGGRGRQASLGGAPRQSLGRRSSAYGRATMKDPRPISDRGYMNNSVRTLLRFLSTEQYDHPLSSKLLTRPTGKDFFNIVKFLFRIVDPNYECTKKMVDEVPLVFKGLGYPFGISKTGLSAVGSPHTWPALLSSLTWLIELLEYDMQAQAAKSQELEKGEGAAEAEHNFYEYLRSAYESFMSGDDKMYQQLEQDLIADGEERDAAVQREIARLRQENEALSAEAHALENSESEVPRLRTILADYRSDLSKFDRLIVQLQAHTKGLQAKRADRMAERDRAQRELDVAEEARVVARQAVEAQELSEEDVKRMAAQRSRLQSELTAASEKKREGIKSLRSHEEDLQEHLAQARAQVIPICKFYDVNTFFSVGWGRRRNFYFFFLILILLFCFSLSSSRHIVILLSLSFLSLSFLSISLSLSLSLSFLSLSFSPLSSLFSLSLSTYTPLPIYRSIFMSMYLLPSSSSSSSQGRKVYGDGSSLEACEQ